MAIPEVDPTIKALADPELISAKAASRFRHHPGTEALLPGDGNASKIIDYSVGLAVWDVLERRSISPLYNQSLMKEAIRRTRKKVPNHEAITSRRIQAAATINEQLAQNLD